METKAFQIEINELLNRVGWSKNKAAKVIFMENNDDDDDDDDDDEIHIQRFQKCFIKDLLCTRQKK